MTSRVVPVGATTTSITAWIGVAGEETEGLELAIGGDLRTIPDAWTQLGAHGETRLLLQRMQVEGLEPGRRYAIALLRGGTPVTAAEAATLPEQLPGPGEPAWTLLLGSCYAHFQDGAGVVSRAIRALPEASRPTMSVLSGDQVYLDAPFPRYLWPRSAADREADLLATYLATWGFLPDRDGLAPLLSQGVNVFGSDDHELWNNAPTPGVLVVDTWHGSGRDHWQRTATALYRAFQSPTPSTALRVGRLSLRVIDTRLDRTADRRRFMSDTDLQGLADWVAGLDGPGVLAIGQPIMRAKAGWKGRFTDYGLPDFEQYGRLAAILAGSRHDLLVLTGDVHYGRVAGCTLPSGATLIELICSPLALVDKAVSGAWEEPPERFPPFPVPGVTQVPVELLAAAHRTKQPHVATLGFRAHGTGVSVAADAWEIPENGAPPQAVRILDRVLS